MLAEKLNMGAEEAERWIVNLIRNASLDAKIDSQKGVVVMGSQVLSPYQTVIEKTKNLFNRTQLLTHNSEKKRDTNVSAPTANAQAPRDRLLGQLESLPDTAIANKHDAAARG